MFNVKFTPQGQKDLEKLTKDIQARVIKKIKFFASQQDLSTFSKPLINLPPATHRFRVGDYRVAFYVEQDTIYVERARHRKEVYFLEIKI